MLQECHSERNTQKTEEQRGKRQTNTTRGESLRRHPMVKTHIRFM